MPKYSDTVLFNVTRYSDTTKQIKRRIYESVLETGFAPKVADIARELGIDEEVVRKSLWDLEGGIIVAVQNKQHLNIREFMGQKLPNDCTIPELGEIFYARPFANFKNHHKIYVDGDQKWYGECPVESVTISYFFPGKEVRVESVCHQTGEPVAIVGRDGLMVEYIPKSLRIYWGRPFGQWLSTQGHEGDFIYPCDENYFFSSEEAFNEWRNLHPQEPGQLFTPIQIYHLLKIFNYGHERFDYQYHFPLIRLLLAFVTAGLFRWKMLVPVPNLFFLTIVKLIRDAYRNNYKPFLDVKLW
ncbi:MAG: organomercurial lyase [Desulfomonilia bacterium]